MAVEYLTKDNFNEKALQAKGTVLVDFFANWCGPCKMLAPILEDFAKDRTDIKVYKVDVDQEGELARKYSVSSIPTLIVFRNGEQVKKAAGFQQKNGLIKLVE